MLTFCFNLLVFSFFVFILFFVVSSSSFSFMYVEKELRFVRSSYGVAMYYDKRHRKDFTQFWFCSEVSNFQSLRNWSRILTPSSHPIRHKTKTNHDLSLGFSRALGSYDNCMKPFVMELLLQSTLEELQIHKESEEQNYEKWVAYKEFASC